MSKEITTYNRYLKIAVGLSLFIILCIGGFSYQHTQKLEESMTMVKHAYEVNLELKELLANLRNSETSERGFILTNDTLFLNNYIINKDKIDHNISNLRSLIGTNTEQLKSLEKLKPQIAERLKDPNELGLGMAFDRLNQLEAPSNILENRYLMDSINASITAILDVENDLLKVRNQANEKALDQTPLILYAILILTLILLLVAYAIINRDMKTLRAANNQLNLFKETANLSEMVGMHGSWTFNVSDDKYVFSDNFYRILGVEPQAFDSTLENFMPYVHRDDVEKLTEQVERMYEEHNLPFITYRIVKTNGEIRHVKAYGELFVNQDGDKTLFGTLSDITDEIDSYRIIEEHNNELERSNEELSAFNYVVSHDLQEPLRKIQTFISRLNDKESTQLSDNGKLYMSRIEKAAARMRLLIDDLLQFSRTNASDDSIELSDMNEILESAKLEIMDDIVKNKAIITYDEMPKMEVIPFQMQQLFINLIGNALKYSKEDVSPHINISYANINASEDAKLSKLSQGIYHKICVTDNGIGFEQGYAEKIFTLFNRLHSKDEYQGTGIGLSICEKIVKNHDGLITATGRPNEGATFCFYLPEIKA